MDLNQQLATRYIAALEAAGRDFIGTLNAYRSVPGKGLNDIFFQPCPPTTKPLPAR